MFRQFSCINVVSKLLQRYSVNKNAFESQQHDENTMLKHILRSF